MSTNENFLSYKQTIDSADTNFKRKLSKREKKEQKKKEKLQKLQSNNVEDSENHVAEKLYTGTTCKCYPFIVIL